MLYQEPKLEFLTLAIDDVICASEGQVTDQGGHDPIVPKDENDLGSVW